jgi:glycosyltransferase involved in cell wall biosynthesis
MITVSLCMIVKNESDVLKRCLDSAANIADEIIILDTGSTDNTKEIASLFTDKIYDFEWVNDFSKARNASFSYAAMDYILWLDADDVIEGENYDKLLELKSTLDPTVDVVKMKYIFSFDANGRPALFFYRERLVRREANFQWKDPIHEFIIISRNVITSDICVSHRKTHPNEPQRNLNIFRRIIESGEPLSARQKFYYARELCDNKFYDEALSAFRTFLADQNGWVEDNNRACEGLSQCCFALNKPDEGFSALFESFHYDAPRAEICCEIGKRLMEKGSYKQAAYWYESARGDDLSQRRGGFIKPDYYDYTPLMQLCVCYSKMGQHEKAEQCNSEAAKIKPESPAVIYNQKYFAKLKQTVMV